MDEVNPNTTQKEETVNPELKAEVPENVDVELQPQNPPVPSRSKPVPLKDLLSTGADRKAEKLTTTATESAPVDLGESIHIVMRLLAETKKVADAAIREKISPILSPNSNNKSINRAFQTLSALSLTSESSPKPENWELGARTEILYSLREQIVNRVMLRNRRVFESSGLEEGMRMVKSLATFRKASRGTEIKYSSRENMVPGSSNTESNVLLDSPKKAKMAALEETLYCLAQLTIGCTKDSLPRLEEAEVIEIQKNSIVLQNPKAARPEIPDLMQKRIATAEEGKLSKESLLSLVQDLYLGLNPDDKSKETLKREMELFDEVESSIGSSIEEVDSLNKEEFGAISALEAAFNELESVEKLDRSRPPESKEELQLKIFQGLREVAGNIGKTTTMVLTTQLSNDEPWVENFIENGADAIYNASAYKKLITITEPENTLFGDPSDPDKFMEEGKTLRDALSLIYQAECALYSGAIYESISQNDREQLQLLANKVIHTEISQGEIDNDPTLKSLYTVQNNAGLMGDAVSKEVEGSEKSLELLPRALKERERQDRIANSLTNSIRLLAKKNVSEAIETLIQDEKEKLDNLLENPEELSENRAPIVNCKEKIATLEALRDLSSEVVSLESGDYNNLLGTISLTRVPRTLREHALISLCDNRAANGTRLKTKDMLVKIEALSKEEGLTNKMRANMGRLRHWKERESVPSEVKRQDLAISICKTPENLKRTIPRELTSALKSCMISPPWKDPFNIAPRDLGNCNGMYLVAKQAYDPEAKILKKIKKLHARTAELQKQAGNSPRQRAEKIAEDLGSNKEGSLQEIESQLLKEILNNQEPKAAIEYMESWYASIGNEKILQEEVIKDEKGPVRPSHSIPYVAARIQTKVENLLEIGRHFKEVASNPEALAEAYIQNRIHQTRGIDKESWEERISRAQKKVDVEINREKRELEDWKTKFNAYFDENIDDELSADEAERSRSIKNVCFLKISQKERAIETLYLKRERLKSLEYTSKSLKRIKNPDEVTNALRQEEDKSLGVSMATAFDAAIALAGNPEKIMLPKPKMTMATPLQMLEAGAVERSVSAIRGVLNEAKNILKERDPSTADLDIANKNPEFVCQELKKTTFKILKEVEMHLWESGKSIKLSKEEEEEFLSSNPEMLSTRKEWIDRLQKTQEELKPAITFADQQPKKKKEKKINKEKNPAEHQEEQELSSTF